MFESCNEKISERFRNDFGNEITNTYIELIKNPFITAKELAKIINRTQRTIENYLNTLKDHKFIERKGPKLGGYWEILIENIFSDKKEEDYE